jgi:hypothetical protein
MHNEDDPLRQIMARLIGEWRAKTYSSSGDPGVIESRGNSIGNVLDETDEIGESLALFCT